MINAQNGTYSVLLAPASVTAGATATANLDVRGADYATILLSRTLTTHTNANNITVSVLESDNTNATTFATIVANVTLSSQASGVYAYHVDTKTRKRYLRLSVTPGTATTDAIVFSAVGLLTRKEESPATTTDMATAATIV